MYNNETIHNTWGIKSDWTRGFANCDNRACPVAALPAMRSLQKLESAADDCAALHWETEWSLIWVKLPYSLKSA
jgi:hypothetical protein